MGPVAGPGPRGRFWGFETTVAELPVCPTHLPADVNFARAVKGQQGPITVRVQGDVAWASSSTTMEGELRGRQINSVSAGLMVFSRESGGWKIRAIHWLSRNRRPPGGP